MYAFEFEGNVKNGFIELPDEYKNKVNTIVKVIIMQEKPISKKVDKKRQFGCGKGIFNNIKDDFDDELEVFKEYST